MVETVRMSKGDCNGRYSKVQQGGSERSIVRVTFEVHCCAIVFVVSIPIAFCIISAALFYID
jgi:hypothetical protein